LATRATRAGLAVCHLLNDKPDISRGNLKTVCHLIDDNRSGKITILRQPAAGEYDGVLVDAPCSGSGTWRRSPHLKWSTTPALIAERAELQHTLLAKFAACVKPGGRLVYATCSLSIRENEQVVARFLTGHASFEPLPTVRAFGFTPRGDGLTILPARHDTDGFFVAAFRRR
ncbi:MAG: hypothetical protein RLZZ15_3267, partial [Verrucomicrobiota bacterium]